VQGAARQGVTVVPCENESRLALAPRRSLASFERRFREEFKELLRPVIIDLASSYTALRIHASIRPSKMFYTSNLHGPVSSHHEKLLTDLLVLFFPIFLFLTRQTWWSRQQYVTLRTY
jgi:hypothetical protein